MTNTVSILVIDDSKADRTANIIECKRIFKNIPGVNLHIEESASLENAFQKSSENTFHMRNFRKLWIENKSIAA